MKISLGRGIGKVVSKTGLTRVTLYRILRRDPFDSDTWEQTMSDWETPKELIDYIQAMFGPAAKTFE